MGIAFLLGSFAAESLLIIRDGLQILPHCWVRAERPLAAVEVEMEVMSVRRYQHLEAVFSLRLQVIDLSCSTRLVEGLGSLLQFVHAGGVLIEFNLDEARIRNCDGCEVLTIQVLPYHPNLSVVR